MSLLLAFAAAAAAQTAPPPATLTLRKARSLSPRDLTRRVLGLAGTRYPEVSLPDTSGGMFANGGISEVRFATMPGSAGFPGLCQAETLLVTFSPSRFEELRYDRPRRVYRLYVSDVFRIVGDTNDPREGTDATERALEAQCARAGPVLTGTPVPRFFGGDQLTGAKAHMAARMLQAVTAAARQGPIDRVTCAEDPAAPAARACSDSRAILAAPPVERLTYVLVDRCAANQIHICANLRFELARSGNQITELRLGIEIDAARADPPPPTFQIVAVTIHHQTVAED